MMLLVALGLGLGFMAWVFLPSLGSFMCPRFSFTVPFKIRMDGGDIISPSLAKFIEETIALENITGLSVAIVPPHAEPEFHTWGYRTEEGDEMTPDTLFYIGSLSKSFCAAAMGILIDDFSNGRNVTALPLGLTELTWRTRLKDLLPEWKLMDEWASERANLHDILSHVSGIPRHDFSYGSLDTLTSVLRKFQHLEPAFELRERFSYNNLMYMVAAHVIETYAGQSYTSFVEERIFSPLGMTSSTFSLAKAEASQNFTQGWSKLGRRLPAMFASKDTAVLVAGAGGVISSAIDMSKWISMWIGGGMHENQAVIPRSVYQNISYAYTIATDHPDYPYPSVSGYGMGWIRYSYRGHDVVLHSGGLFGFSTVLTFLPSDGLGVSVFANGGSQSEPVLVILHQILDVALGLPVTGLSHPFQTFLTRPTTQSPQYVTETSACDVTSHLDALGGTYTHPGYGSLTLCGPSSPGSYCTRVRSDFTPIDDPKSEGDSRGLSMELLAAWPRFWASHVRMQYRKVENGDGHKGGVENNKIDERPGLCAVENVSFDVHFVTLFPEGYGKDQTPFELAEIGIQHAEFFVDEKGRVIGFELQDGLTRAWFEKT